jgi:hypothetical protein
LPSDCGNGFGDIEEASQPSFGQAFSMSVGWKVRKSVRLGLRSLGHISMIREPIDSLTQIDKGDMNMRVNSEEG